MAKRAPLPPEWLRRGGKVRHGLTASQRAVLMCLWDHSDKDLVSYPSAPTVAFETSLSERTVKTEFVALSERGFITRAEPSVKGAHSRLAVTWVLAKTVPSATTALDDAHEKTVPSATTAVGPSATTARRRKNKGTLAGLPDLGSGYAAADDGMKAESNKDRSRSHRAEGAPATEHGGTSRAGNEAAGPTPQLEVRQTTNGRVPAEPEYARDLARVWPDVAPIPGVDGRPAA